MDSQSLFENVPFDTCAGFPFDWDHTTAVNLPGQRTSGLGHAKRLPERKSQSSLDEDYDLFESEVMDKFFFDVTESNPSRNNYTTSSSAAFCGLLEAEGTSPPANEKRIKAVPDGSSPVPEVVIDIPGERRRAQNRAAQRAHRERQKRYVAQLEKRFFALQANYNHLDEKYKKVEREHQSLIQMLSSRQTPTPSPASQASVDSYLSICIDDPLVPNEFLLHEQEPAQALALGIDGMFSTKLGVP
ncbi:uncharacterized protein Z520_07444 [Fonsecaea multimorphosa CBS 102226]|uniref:BZIP domain-containing protein n=1 Tax=Fonsecaea multimorphosa CBS 102226 TaxID=1442371 RepID=A0A0D2H4F5_9EURO|nr:uncharacterized protein Z520_07444 [Fonsecaea multimorphosa CBS 102226]KIX96725.1 hypothetical protein Z520_07444 [Fonsecaea multimorphosa CBS 102226]OAL22406.1 hypothetical protein AYO22_06963 [Fonsecaea multimorphosa]